MRTTAVILLLTMTGSLAAQDSITLFDCHLQALENAPRLSDREIIRQIGALKVDNAGTSWFPSLNLNGKLSYQSDVVTVALTDPTIPVSFPEVPHDQYGLNLDVSQNLYDGGITRQTKVFEEAATAADLQQVEVDLYGLKSKVNQFYFAILVLQENRKNLDIHMDNLMTRCEVMNSAIEHGTMLETDLKVVDVEILRVKQSVVEIDARRKSFLGVLNVLCGEEFHEGIHLAAPILDGLNGEQNTRPEYQWFDLENASMEAGKELMGKKRMPVLYAFGQTGYGKPGYNMMSEEWDFYYMLGAGLRWNIWDWNSSNRERQVIEQQQQILRNRRASFDQEIESLMVQEEAKMEQYKKSMELEKRVLKIQTELSENAAIKLANGTITATEYITELNKENVARINLATHQIQLMQSFVNFLTIQGNL
ncbi:MAG: TolC family protein [Bacteroidales bacterium]|nr:TolC family protein [Bacteroidales bacterium]